MTNKEALEQIMTIYGETNSLEGTYDLFLKIKQALERLEKLQEAVEILYDICPHSAKMLYRHGKISYDEYMLLEGVISNVK